jgi:membrane-bound ClpP family serine protease
MAATEPTIPDLIKRALDDAQDLVRSEIALAKAELQQEMRRVSAGAAALAGAGVAALLGAVFLLTTAAWAISETLGWPAWSGFGIVTLVLLIAAGIMYAMGRARIRATRRLPLTTDTMKENLKWMRARTS